jgi:hypothetical protein
MTVDFFRTIPSSMSLVIIRCMMHVRWKTARVHKISRDEFSNTHVIKKHLRMT